MFNRQALRSASAWKKPELGQPLSNYFHLFSASARPQAEDSSAKNNAQNPSYSPLRRRSKALSEEIRSLVVNKHPQPRAASTTTQGGAPPRVQPTSQPRVIDVKSLPRGGLRGGFRGRGGLRGRGGFQGGPREGGAPTGGFGNRFSREKGEGFRGRGRGRGRGGRGNKKRGRGRRSGELEEGGSRRSREPELDESDLIEPAEKQFDDAIRFGTQTTYIPSLTLESLAQYMPPVASSEGKGATVLQNLNYLGPGEHIATSQGLQASSYAAAVKESGIRFFANVESKKAAEEYLQRQRYDEAVAKAKAEAPDGAEPAPVKLNTEPIVRDIEESIKKVILDQAVAGNHESLKEATDPVTTSRNWHLRSETWTEKEIKMFEDKLTSLLAKSGKGSNKKTGAKA